MHVYVFARMGTVRNEGTETSKIIRMKKIIALVSLVCLTALARAQQPVLQDTVSKKDTVDVIFSIVEVEPQFPGGDEAMYSFLSKNIVYPSNAKEKGIEGVVVVGFVVEKDGRVSNIKVIRSVHESLDAEAVRLVKAMPRWVPGRQRGVAVRTRFLLPFNFQLK